MNKATIKSAYLKIKASDEFKQKTVALLQGNIHKRNSSRIRPIAAIAASLVVVIAFVAVFTVFQHENILAPHSTLTIPKISLQKGNTQMTFMIGLVVYNGRIYTQTGTNIDIGNAKKLLGDKLGTAKGNIDEWSKQGDYTVELASNFIGDVYTVKGYDSSFRIIGISKNPNSGEESAEFFECYNGITVSSGKDVLGKLKIQGNASSLTYVQWYDGETPIYSVSNETLMNEFIDALNGTTPYLPDHIPGLDWNNSADFRKVKIKLKDGCDVQFTLTIGGYIFYGNNNLTFKMNGSVFNELWDKLDYSKDPSTKGE